MRVPTLLHLLATVLFATRATHAAPTTLNGPTSPQVLAFTNSMSPASIPFLLLPTTPLNNSATESWVAKSWGYIGGFTKYLSFVEDPIEKDGTQCLEVLFPKGSEGGEVMGTEGGVGDLQLGVFGAVQRQRAIMSYQVAFSPDFDFVNGGKLPGLFGGNGTCSGGSHNTGCFSVRLMWRSGGRGEVYAYIPEYYGLSSERRSYGLDIAVGSWNFTVGAWNTVTEVAILNSDPGETSPANGHLALYYNGHLAFSRDDIVFRTDPTVGVDSFMVSSFFGGSGSSFWASKGGSAHFRNFQFFSGSEPSTTDGRNVAAYFPGGSR